MANLFLRYHGFGILTNLSARFAGLCLENQVSFHAWPECMFGDVQHASLAQVNDVEGFNQWGSQRFGDHDLFIVAHDSIDDM